MNTKRSQDLISRSNDRSSRYARRVLAYPEVVAGTPEDVFPLLCPSREADWIPGWEAELIHTESGFAELDCVFRTAANSRVGPGVWVITRCEAPKVLQLVRFTPDVLIQLKAHLEPAGSGQTSVHWQYLLTALTEAGSIQVQGAEDALKKKAAGLSQALDHYLRTGELMSEG